LRKWLPRCPPDDHALENRTLLFKNALSELEKRPLRAPLSIPGVMVDRVEIIASRIPVEPGSMIEGARCGVGVDHVITLVSLRARRTGQTVTLVLPPIT
jgi:hypothetical protein